MVGLGVLLVVIGLVSAASGQFAIAPGDIFSSILRKVGIGAASDQTRLIDSTLWQVRFPRLVLSMIVGAALAVAGALMQGVFNNPLAEPGVIGVSSGCAVGACAVIVFNLDAHVSLVLPLVALIGGLLVAAAVYTLARTGGRADTVTLLLIGIAINAVAGAVVAFLIFIADTASREQIVFWQMGSLNGATWPAVRDSAIIAVIGVAGAMLIRRKVDVLALGESAAGHVGINVERVKRQAILFAALLSAGAVAYAGLIAFVGLVIPHLLRLLIGPSNRALIPASAIGGAILLAGADILSRTMVAFADLPIGIFTALIGGPVFFALLRKRVLGGLGR